MAANLKPKAAPRQLSTTAFFESKWEDCSFDPRRHIALGCPPLVWLWGPSDGYCIVVTSSAISMAILSQSELDTDATSGAPQAPELEQRGGEHDALHHTDLCGWAMLSENRKQPGTLHRAPFK